MKKPLRNLLRALAFIAACACIVVFGTTLIKRGYKQYYRAIYPLHYADEITTAAEEFDVPPSLIYAIVYTESGFNPQAISSAGAKGLMQLTDTTLEWALKRADEADKHAPEELFDPAINIHYGVYVLTLLEEQFESTETILAAYNAGIGRVNEWLKDPAYSDDGVQLKAIPYQETADYVRRVRETQKFYQNLYSIP